MTTTTTRRKRAKRGGGYSEMCSNKNNTAAATRCARIETIGLHYRPRITCGDELTSTLDEFTDNHLQLYTHNTLHYVRNRKQVSAAVLPFQSSRPPYAAFALTGDDRGRGWGWHALAYTIPPTKV